MRRLLIYIFLLVSGSSFSQYGKTKVIPVVTPEYSAKAEILIEQKEIKTDHDVFYHWIKAKEIHVTQGGFDGNLLHGTYRESYKSEQLRTSGQFRYGIKTGLWISWWENGRMKEISSWKNGKINGKVKRYDESGKLIFNGRYSDDRYNGTITEYDSSGNEIRIRYRMGEEKTRKKKIKKKIKKKDIIPMEEVREEEKEKEKDKDKDKEKNTSDKTSAKERKEIKKKRKINKPEKENKMKETSPVPVEKDKSKTKKSKKPQVEKV